MVDPEPVRNHPDISESVRGHKPIIECHSKNSQIEVVLEDVEGIGAILPSAISHEDIVLTASLMLLKEFSKLIPILFLKFALMHIPLKRSAVVADTVMVKFNGREILR